MLGITSKSTLDCLEQCGIINTKDINEAQIRQMENELMNNDIKVPVINHRKKGEVIQYYTTIPKRYSTTDKRKQITGKTEKEVHDAYIKTVYNKVYFNSIEKQTITVADGISVYLKHLAPQEKGINGKAKVKDTTLSRYQGMYKNYIQDTKFGSIYLNQLKDSDCEDFIQFLYDRGIVFNSIKQIVSLVNRAFKHLIKLEILQTNAISGIKVNESLCSEDNKRVISVWEDTEVKELCEFSIQYWAQHKRYRYSAVILILIFTGMRIGELCAATWDDVNFDERTFQINKTFVEYTDYDSSKKCRKIDVPKTANAKRVLYLCDSAIYWLKNLKDRNEQLGIHSELIVVTKNGRIPKSAQLKKTFERFCIAANLPYKTSHTCRRTYVTKMLDNGVPVAEVSRDVGHKNVTTTLNIYYKAKCDNKYMDVKESALTAYGVPEDWENSNNSKRQSNENKKVVKFDALRNKKH